MPGAYRFFVAAARGRINPAVLLCLLLAPLEFNNWAITAMPQISSCSLYGNQTLLLSKDGARFVHPATKPFKPCFFFWFFLLYEIFYILHSLTLTCKKIDIVFSCWLDFWPKVFVFIFDTVYFKDILENERWGKINGFNEDMNGQTGRQAYFSTLF